MSYWNLLPLTLAFAMPSAYPNKNVGNIVRIQTPATSYPRDETESVARPPKNSHFGPPNLSIFEMKERLRIRCVTKL